MFKDIRLQVKYLVIISTLLITSGLKAQRYFYEDFEQGIPGDWTQEYLETDVTSDVTWSYRNGGRQIGPEKFPSAAKHGSLNAYFIQEASRGEKTRLITTPVDLSNSQKPEFSFWHAQAEYGEGTGDFERLRVFIKPGEDGEWVKVQEYLDPEPVWVRRSFFIADSLKHDSTYIAFEGETNWGAGLCLDSIEIIEKGIVPYHLKSISYHQEEFQFLSSSSTENEMLKLHLDVFGNTGTLVLDEISFSIAQFGGENIEPNSCKLYLTDRDHFNTVNQLGTNQSATGDSIVFGSLDHDLDFGKNYLWLSVGIKDTTDFNDSIDASFKQNGIKMSLDTAGFGEYSSIYLDEDLVYYIVDDDTSNVPLSYTLPDSEQSPNGVRRTKNTLYFEDFEGSNNWILGGDFEIDSPQGLGATDVEGSPDPEHAISGSKVLGTDLTGLGTKPGDYENLTPVYYAQLDTLNATYYNGLYLSYFIWLNKDSQDPTFIEISTDSSQTWTKVKQYTGDMSTNFWAYDTVNLEGYNADQAKYLSVRFGMGGTNSVDALSGWNIDNFTISGNFIDKDVGVSSIVEPLDECGHTTTDTIKAWVRNFAGYDVVDTLPIPIYFSLNGGSTKIYDTVFANIPVKDSALVTLDVTANLAQPDIYTLIVATDLEGDEGPDNDDHSKTIYAFPTYTPGYTENFESNEGVFKDYGRSEKWQYGNFTGQMSPPPSGVKGWATGHGSNYNANDSSYLETGCYDFTGGGRQLVEFRYWMQTVAEEDGFNLQFSLDEGTSWHVLDSNEFNYNWGWFTDTVEALNDLGWSGDNGGWQTVRQLLPDSFSTEPKVKFRFHFASMSDSDTDNGIGIDNFRIYDAPNDIGVASIDSLADTCQYVNPEHISVSIENYGLNKLNAGDSIVLGFEITGSTSEGAYSSTDLDTIYLENDLLPSAQLGYKFNKRIDVTAPGNYSVKAYTKYESDPLFYFTNNDTGYISFEVRENPLTLMPDTVTTKEPDTVVIRPDKNPDYEYLWEDMSTADSFQVEDPGVYYLTLTDAGGNQCFTIDSVFVELLFNDGGIDSLISPITSCELGNSEILRVNLYNFGTDSLLAGEPVDIYFEMNDGPPQMQSFTLPEVIYRQTSHEFEMTDFPLDLSSPGTYKFKMYADIGGDTIPSNDTTISYVTVHGYPNLDIGEDMTLEAYEYTLNAQSGYDQYLWDDGSTADSFVVDTSNWGNHWVTVTDTNSCSSSDTAYIRLIVRDIIPKEIISPVSGCEIPGETTVSMILENIGNDTLLAGQKIYVSYQVNEDDRHRDTITLTGSLYPNQQFEYDFNAKGDFSDPDDYSFNVTATSYDDLTTSNDTINQLVVIDDNPDIDFGDDITVDAYEYTLEAPENANWNYVWKNSNGTELQNGPDHTLTVNVSNQYHVIATDNSSGCIGGDTIQLIIRVKDLIAEDDNIPLVICQGQSITPELYVRQNGNFTLSSGTYSISYGIEGESSFEEDYTFNQPFSAGVVDTVVLSNPLVFDNTGSGNTFFEISYDGDMNNSNDNNTKEVFVNTSPVVELANGEDTLTQELPFTLDAGNFAAYEWQDNSTNQTFNVTQAGDYSVTVTDNNGCQASDEVHVDALTAINYASEVVNEVNIYPVPTSGELTIKLSIRERMEPRAEIYDLRGKLVLSKELGDGTEIEKLLQLDILETGVYNLRIVDNQLLYQTNIIISR